MMLMRTAMENAGLIFWPILSIFIFGGSCFAMVLWVFRSGSGDAYNRLGAMALEDSGSMPPSRRLGK